MEPEPMRFEEYRKESHNLIRKNGSKRRTYEPVWTETPLWKGWGCTSTYMFMTSFQQGWYKKRAMESTFPEPSGLWNKEQQLP